MKDLPDGPAISGMDLLQIFMSNPFPFLKECYEKYGDMFTLNLGTFGIDEYQASGAWVFLCDADLLKILFKTNSDIISAGKANDIQFQQLIPKEAMVFLDGPRHIDRRKILAKEIQNNGKIREYTAAMYQTIKNHIKTLPAHETFALTPVLRNISSDIMGDMIFGTAAKEDVACINARLSKLGDPTLPLEEKRDLVAGCGNTIKKIIDEHQSCPHLADKGKNNVFNVLMNAFTEDKILTERDVNAELMAFMVGGADTTGNTMAWIFAWIFLNPDVLAKIQHELQQVCTNEPPTSEDFDKLDYLEAVIKEGCRLSALLNNSSARLLLQPLELGGYLLPTGTMVVSCPYVIHTRADYYPDPMAFKPERFIGVNPDPFKWLLYGGGIRRCIGMAFALYEMKVVIATLLQQCKFEPVNISTDVELQGSFFAPKGSVAVKLNA